MVQLTSEVKSIATIKTMNSATAIEEIPRQPTRMRKATSAMQAAKEPDEYQDRYRHPEKPQQQIASHRLSSSFVVRELVAWPWGSKHVFFKAMRGLRNKKLIHALSFAIGARTSEVRVELVLE